MENLKVYRHPNVCPCEGPSALTLAECGCPSCEEAIDGLICLMDDAGCSEGDIVDMLIQMGPAA